MAGATHEINFYNIGVEFAALAITIEVLYSS
jgi:hypothetical protein